MMYRRQDGFILISATMTMFFFMTVAVAIYGFAMNHFISARRSVFTLSALEVAEAGADEAMYQLNRDANYDGTWNDTPSETVLFNDDIKGRGTYETKVEAGTISNEKFVTATARIYLPRTAIKPFATRKVRLTARGTVPFRYAIQTGTGPLYLFGNTGFSGTIHSNNFIRIQDNAVNISGGDITVAGTDPYWTPANQCSISKSGSVTGGTIRVSGQLTPAPPNCGPDTTGSTVIEAAVVPPEPLPSVDYSAVSGSIAISRPISNLTNPTGAEPHTIESAHYEASTDSRTPCTPGTFGLQNVTLKRNRAYTLAGNAHIRGDLIMEGNVITVADGLLTPPTILVDGMMEIKGNGVSIAANSAGIGAVIAIYDCTDAGTTITSGSDAEINGLKTEEAALRIDGNSISLYANFVVPNGSIRYNARGTVGKLAAKTTVINGSGLTTFVDITNGVPANPDIWDVTFYQQVFD